MRHKINPLVDCVFKSNLSPDRKGRKKRCKTPAYDCGLEI